MLTQTNIKRDNHQRIFNNNADISQYVSQFLEWKKSDKTEGEEWEKERNKRRKWYGEKLSEDKIDFLTEDDFAKLIKDLWATNVWNNKDYKVNRLLKDNNFQVIKKTLKNLLFGQENIEKRWDDFRAEIKGMGPSSLSEILTFSDPDKYSIVNLKPLSLLPVIGVLTETELKEYSYSSLNGKRYTQLLAILTKIRQFLQENGLKNADFIDTDFFIAYLFYNVFELFKERNKEAKISEALDINKTNEKLNKLKIEEKIHSKIIVHEEAEYTLLRLGQLLGYDTYTPDRNKEAGETLSTYTTLKDLPPFTYEDLLRIIKEIDVIWFKEDFPEVCFEVEHTTGVSSGLLRFYQVRKFNTKLFIIAPKEVNSKYAIEINKEPFRQMQERFNFRSYEELSQFFTTTELFISSKELFLERSK